MTALGLSLALIAAADAPPPELHALVVAHNRSADGTLAPLRFADDDGARWYETLRLASAKVSLLSVMDAETQAQHPEAARVAIAPTAAELQRALDATFADIAAARRAGKRTAFFFVYVGHGSVDADGVGSMHLVDATISRRHLFERVIEPSPATVNHIIVDACHAYTMVAKRGAQTLEAHLDRALAGFLAREELDAYPNTGVLLATSSSREVHEWSRYRAGIFSHEVRSALSGAGDVDGDGAVTYAEVGAFVAAANAKVTNPSARLEIFSRPPAVHLREPLFDRAWAPSAATLRVPEELAGRWWLEDERGVRIADFHTAAGSSVTLTLVPRKAYFLRNATQEIELRALTHADASDFARRASPLARRGGEARALERGLFAVPFGPAWFEGFAARPALARPEAPPAWAATEALDEGWGAREFTALSLFTGAVAAGIASAVLIVEAENTATRYREDIGTDDDLDDLKTTAETQNLTGSILGGVAGALAAGGLLTLVF